MTAEREPFYAWSGEWPQADDGSHAMSHTSVVITRDGHVVLGRTNEPALAFYDRDGQLAAVSPVADAVELHGLTLVQEGGAELIWVADTAAKLYGGGAELEVRDQDGPGQVSQIDPFDGRRVRTLDRPGLDVYEREAYRPTAVAVDETRFGGSGDIWVADGYGASLVHRYDAAGRHLQALDGESGAGRFNQPHDLLIVRRSAAAAELYVADRMNQRIQVYDLDGRFKRTVGEGLLPGPTQMAMTGESVVVTDLLAGRLTMFDRDDQLIGHLFANPSPPPSWDQQPDAWPNVRAADGSIAAATLESGVFHSPHGVGVAADGTVYVTEFAIGGRVAVLTPRNG